jgi:HSP20 family protein
MEKEVSEMFGMVPFDKKSNQLRRSESDIFDIERLFENFFNDTIFPAYYAKSGQMKVDIKDNENEYVVEAELPGVKKEDIGISIDEDRLTIRASSREETEEKKENYLRRERRSESMTRSFYIQNVDADHITANMNDGILTVNLPKLRKIETKSKKIDVN